MRCLIHNHHYSCDQEWYHQYKEHIICKVSELLKLITRKLINQTQKQNNLQAYRTANIAVQCFRLHNVIYVCLKHDAGDWSYGIFISLVKIWTKAFLVVHCTLILLYVPVLYKDRNTNADSLDQFYKAHSLRIAYKQSFAAFQAGSVSISHKPHSWPVGPIQKHAL